MTWAFAPLLPLSFDVILIDPPTPFDLYSETGADKSASAHYETMAWDDLADLPISQLARGDCLVLMCATGCALPHSLRLMNRWGITYKSEIAWRKVTKNGKVRMGPGYRVRTMHEPILLGTIGNPQHKPFPSIFDGVAREHSRKPEELYSLIIKHTPNAVHRADLFSRATRPGFIGWGKEATKFDPPTTQEAA